MNGILHAFALSQKYPVAVPRSVLIKRRFTEIWCWKFVFSKHIAKLFKKAETKLTLSVCHHLLAVDSSTCYEFLNCFWYSKICSLVTFCQLIRLPHQAMAFTNWRLLHGFRLIKDCFANLQQQVVVFCRLSQWFSTGVPRKTSVPWKIVRCSAGNLISLTSVPSNTGRKSLV